MGLNLIYIAMDVNFPDYYGGAKRAYETARIFQAKGYEVSLLVFRKAGEPEYECYQGLHVYRASINDIGVLLRKLISSNAFLRKIKKRSVKTANDTGKKFVYADYFHPKPLVGVKNKAIDFYRHRFPVHKYLRNLSAFKLLWKILRERKIDVIIERGPSYGVGALISRLTGRLYVVDFIDIMYSNFSLKMADLVLSYFSTIQIPSFVSRAKVWKVYTSADEKKFKPMPKDPELLSRYGFKEDNFILIYSGAMYYWHGLDVMVEAVKRLVDNGHKEIRMIFLGDGEARPQIETLVKKYCLNGFVVFTGKVPFDEVPRYLACADVALTLNTGDSIGFKLIEYMAAGKAIITTNVDFVHTIADNHKDLFFVPVSDPEAVVNKILTLKNNPSLRNQFEQNVRQKFLKNLTWDAHYHNICTGLIKTIKNKRGSN